MKKKILKPQVIAGPVLFDIDYEKQMLIDYGPEQKRLYDGPLNRLYPYGYNEQQYIPFNDLRQGSGYRSLFYDYKPGKVFVMPKNQCLEGDLVELKMDERIFKPGTFKDAQLIDEINAWAYGHSHYTVMVTLDIQERLNGKLPHIIIEGEDFTIDVRMNQLRRTEAPWEVTTGLPEIGDNADGLFLFNQVTKKLTTVDPEMRAGIPADTVLVQIPTVKHLDPVGAAVAVRQPAVSNLCMYRFQSNITAKRVTAEKAGLREINQRDRNSFGASDKTNKRQALRINLGRPPKRRGRGL